MKIEKLEVKGFGKLNNLTLEFKKGLNIVYGNNETGKSSLQWFIRGMLYGLKGGRTTKEGLLPAIKKFKPWKLSDYSGIIEYRLDSGEWFRVGRNYNTNSVQIYDALFNEITNTFDSNKEKGAQFAEKHLGINENCFEKTVFIKQMDTKIDEDGSKELLNKLTNVVQTGFEDISFRKAQEALKEALKNHIGTDKTSTRPLDKVIARLEQLNLKKHDLIKKRESMFEIENRLNIAVSQRDNLQNKKQVFYLIKDLLDLEKAVEKNTKLRSRLDEIAKDILIAEEELKAVSLSINEFNKTKDTFERFSTFDNDDVDTLGLQYYELLRLIESNKKLERELQVKTSEKEKAELYLKEFKGFEGDRGGIEEKLKILNKELEQLKLEHEKSNIEILNERIKSAQYKQSRGRINIISSGMVTIIFLLIGIFKMPVAYVAAAIGAITTIVLFAAGRKASRELFELLNLKKVSFISISSIADEINKKQKLLNGILSLAGAENIEEFIKLKAEYDNRLKEHQNIIETLRLIQIDFNANAQRIDKLDERLREMLYTAGITIDKDNPIRDEDVNVFKNGVRSFDAKGSGIDYTLQRLQDINKRTAVLYDNARALSGIKIENPEDIKEFIYKVDENIRIDAERFKEEISRIRNVIIEKRAAFSESIYLEGITEKFNLIKAAGILEKECGLLEAEYNDTLLNVRECETLLRGVTDDDEIQSIDEEIGELEAKKHQLQDINSALKKALELLTLASTEIQRDFGPALNQKMSAAVKSITNGRYNELRADDNLAIKTIAPETGEVVSALSLSGGTVDQMYLALRIAMVDMIAPACESIPLILDEVFAQYDDIRTREALLFMKELSRERQIVLFTCKSREVEIAREVCKDSINIINME